MITVAGIVLPLKFLPVTSRCGAFVLHCPFNKPDNSISNFNTRNITIHKATATAVKITGLHDEIINRYSREFYFPFSNFLFDLSNQKLYYYSISRFAISYIVFQYVSVM